MWKCAKCGHQFSDTDNKCWACGTLRHGNGAGGSNSSQHCPKCNKEYDTSWKVCLDCGVALDQGTSVREPVVKESAAPQTQKNWKTTVISVVSFIAIIFAGAIGKELGAVLFKRPIASNASINVESLNWQRQSPGISGISLEFPVVLKEKAMRIPQQVMQYIKDTKSYDGTSGDLTVNITMVQYVDTIQTNLDGAVNGSIAELTQTVNKQGGTGFRYDTQRTYISGREAVLLTAECVYPSISGMIKFRNLIFADGSKAWIVQTIYRDNPNSAKMAERIIGSVEKE